MNALHLAAREAIARGWAVFPLKAREKIPIIGPSRKGADDGGFHLATTNADQIDAWWKAWPDANVGLATGAVSGFFVVDLDGPEAEAALAALEQEHGALPATLQQLTRKGRHILFKMAPGVRNRGGGYLRPDAAGEMKRVKCAGFDVRGDGGYIVMSPSIHPSGFCYAWLDAPAGRAIAEAPRWLLEAIVPPPPKPAAPYKPRENESGRASAYGEKALDSACSRIAGAQPGTQNTTLTSEAAAIGELVAGGAIERGYAESALNSAAMQMACGGKPWLPDEVAKKIAWGFEVGRAHPRKGPERQESKPRWAHRADKNEAIPKPDAFPRGKMIIAPPGPDATLIVTTQSIAEDAALAWEASHGGPYGLWAVETRRDLGGGIARNGGGFHDWRNPAPDGLQKAATIPWKGRVLVVLPNDLKGFTASPNTKFERFISSDRQAQVMAQLASHWWKRAGASDVAVAVLPEQEKEQAA